MHLLIRSSTRSLAFAFIALGLLVIALDADAQGMDATRLKALTAEQATDIVKQSKPLRLAVTELSPEVATVLASSKAELQFDALTTLTPESAAALAKCEGHLGLPKLAELSPAAAKALAPHTGVLMMGLKELSDETAAALAKRAGDTRLDSLTSLTSLQTGVRLTANTGNSVPVLDGNKEFQSVALTDGQLLVGRTGNTPIAANLTAGSGINITNAAGAVTISATGGGGGESFDTDTNKVLANTYAGADLGAKINAAITDVKARLGKGLVYVNAPATGTISTQIIVEPNITLEFGEGTFTFTTPSVVAGYTNYPIRQKSNSTIKGQGIDRTILVESNYYTVPDGPALIVIASWGAHPAVEFQFQGIDENLRLEDFTILGGTNPQFDSARSTVSWGNVHGGLIQRVKLKLTRTLGITVGGQNIAPTNANKRAKNVTVQDCIFESVAAQNLNVVNGENIILTRNRFFRHGQVGGPGATFLDLESNTPNDTLRQITVSYNHFDSRNAANVSNHIAITNSNSGVASDILVTGNTGIGGKIQEADGTITNDSASFLLAAHIKRLTVSNNKVTRTGQGSFYIEDCDQAFITGNQLFVTGGGGGPAVRFISPVGSSNKVVFTNNVNDNLDTTNGGFSNEVISTGTAIKMFALNNIGFDFTTFAGTKTGNVVF